MKGGAFEILHHCYYDTFGLLPAMMLPAMFPNLDFVVSCSFCFLHFVSTETQNLFLFSFIPILFSILIHQANEKLNCVVFEIVHSEHLNDVFVIVVIWA